MREILSKKTYEEQVDVFGGIEPPFVALAHRSAVSPNSFSLNSRDHSHMCNVLVKSVVTDLEPSTVVLFCNFVLDAYLSGIAQRFCTKSNMHSQYWMEHLGLFTEPFQKLFPDCKE